MNDESWTDRREIEVVLAAMNLWGEAVESGDPDNVVPLYDPEIGVLWGTLSARRRDTPPAIREYFERFLAHPNIRVRFVDPYVRLLADGAVAVNTGYYAFSWDRADGGSDTLYARYSFTLRKARGRWLIVDHHSSAVPESDI